MALTRNGKRIGAARHTEIMQENEYINSVSRPAIKPTLQSLAFEFSLATSPEEQIKFSAALDWTKSTNELIAEYQRALAFVTLHADNDPRTPEELGRDLDWDDEMQTRESVRPQ